MNNDNIYNILKNFNKVAVQETAKPVEAKPKTQLAENMEQVLGKKFIAEKAVNKYAVGMSQAMKSTGDKPPLKKNTIVKAHAIAKKVKEGKIDDYLDAKKERERERGEEEKKSNKRTVVGHYGKHYDPTDDDEDVVQKAKDTSGEKRGPGRPTGSVRAQTKADTANIKADKKKQVKGNVTKVKSGKKVKEGQYKTIEAMIKEAFGDEDDEQGQLSYEQDQLKQAIGDEAFAQVQEFVDQGADPMALPDELYDVLYTYYTRDQEKGGALITSATFNKLMPYGTQKARDGDPYEWISEKLMSVFGDDTPPFDPDEKSNFKKPSEADKGVERSQALRNRGMDSVKDVTEVTGDKPFDKMMGNIVKGAGALKKKSSNDKFEQVYDRVEVILMQDYFHSYLSDDIPDALVKLKIKPTDELIQRLETAFVDRSSDVLNFYDDDDMEESQQGVLEAMPNARAEYDDQATFNMAQQITAAIEKMTAAKSDINRGDTQGTYQIVVNPSVTNKTKGYGTGQTGPGASVANISDAVGPYMRHFREKGWMFTQPMQGQFTIGIPKQQGVVEDFATLRHYKAFGVDLVEYIGNMNGVEVQPDDDAMTSATITIDVQGNPDEAKELADMAKQGKIKPVGGPTTRDMAGKARRTGTKYITPPAIKGVAEGRMDEGAVGKLKELYQSLVSKVRTITNFKQYYDAAKLKQQEVVDAIKTSKNAEELKQKIAAIAEPAPVMEEFDPPPATASVAALAVGLFETWAAQVVGVYSQMAVGTGADIVGGLMFGVLGQVGCIGLALYYAIKANQRRKRNQDVAEGKKPNFLDMDKDGNKKEPMKKAIKDKEDDELAEMMRLSGINVDEDKLAKKDYDKDGKIETGSEEHAGAVDKAIKKNQDTDEEKVDECMGSSMMSPVPGQAMGQAMEQEGKMNINTNMSSDGSKSVSITADGEAAVQLMQMLKLAGMGGQGTSAPQAESEAEVDEEKDPRYQANTSPEEHVMPVQALTKGGNGDVAGKEKAMTPNGYQFGDNPRAIKEDMNTNEAYVNNAKDVINLLAGIRKQSKMAELGQGDPVSPNQLVNDLYDVMQWIEANMKESVNTESVTTGDIQGLDNFGHDMMKEYESIKIKK